MKPQEFDEGVDRQSEERRYGRLREAALAVVEKRYRFGPKQLPFELEYAIAVLRTELEETWEESDA